MAQLEVLNKKKRVLYKKRKFAFDKMDDAKLYLLLAERIYDEACEDLEKLKAKIKKLKEKEKQK